MVMLGDGCNRGSGEACCRSAEEEEHPCESPQ